MNFIRRLDCFESLLLTLLTRLDKITLNIPNVLSIESRISLFYVKNLTNNSI